LLNNGERDSSWASIFTLSTTCNHQKKSLLKMPLLLPQKLSNQTELSLTP
jgi:hypothetical protein